MQSPPRECQSALNFDPGSASNIDPGGGRPRSPQGGPAHREVTATSLTGAMRGGLPVGPRGGAGGGWGGFLKAQLWFPCLMMSQWWVGRSRSAVVILASPKTEGHSAKVRLVVTMIEVCS